MKDQKPLFKPYKPIPVISTIANFCIWMILIPIEVFNLMRGKYTMLD